MLISNCILEHRKKLSSKLNRSVINVLDKKKKLETNGVQLGKLVSMFYSLAVFADEHERDRVYIAAFFALA